MSNLEKCSGSDISHKSLDSVPQPLEFHRGQKKGDVYNSPKKLPHYLYPSAITLPPVLTLSFMAFSLSFSHLSSLSSGELMWLIKGRVFKGFSTSALPMYYSGQKIPGKNCIPFSLLIISSASSSLESQKPADWMSAE